MKNFILASALIFAIPALSYAQNVKENRIDVSEHFPLSLNQAGKMPEIQKLPISDLIGFGVNPEDIKARTRIVNEQKAQIALKNEKGLYAFTIVEELSFDLLGNVVSFKLPASQKNQRPTLIQTTAAQDVVASFQFEKDGQIFRFHRVDQLLDGAKLNGKSKTLKVFAQRLITSRYVQVSKYSQASLVEDLFKKNVGYIFSFKKVKNKSYYIEGNVSQVKEQLRFIFPEFKADIDAFIASNKLFEYPEKIEKDLLLLSEYIITSKYPRISNVKTGVDEFEVLEVEIK